MRMRPLAGPSSEKVDSSLEFGIQESSCILFKSRTNGDGIEVQPVTSNQPA
jgi:hypothetical protein